MSFLVPPTAEVWVVSGQGLPEAAGDVVFGLLQAGSREQNIGGVAFDESPHIEKCGAVGNAGCLLHIVGDDNDRELIFQLVDTFLDALGGNGVQSAGAGFQKIRLPHFPYSKNT